MHLAKELQIGVVGIGVHLTGARLVACLQLLPLAAAAGEHSVQPRHLLEAPGELYRQPAVLVDAHGVAFGLELHNGPGVAVEAEYVVEPAFLLGIARGIFVVICKARTVWVSNVIHL
jgi:hypothetical protein